MSRIFKPSGGYRKLHSFNFATIVHLGAIRFCRQFIPWQEDPLGKVVGAARSGRINIAEGSERAGTSTETEIKLTDVARASLAELQNDLETWLAERELIPWSIANPEHQKVSAVQLESFEYGEDVLHAYWTYLHRQRHKFDPWLAHDDPAVVVNALIVLIQRATALLYRQMQALEESFVRDGGIKERMYKARTAATDERAPTCPQCGKPMRPRRSAKGPFWGCSGYPECKAILDGQNPPAAPAGRPTRDARRPTRQAEDNQ
ncbi:MAG: four helix bundle suffix domain-containing protein [Candidatus Marinimicrobia bacterium]|nr:four helix bundle suffix domain-containing protein [Candidatus Neomarinimicrobiota bacterium]